MAVIKRYSAPRFWGMKLKQKKYAVRPVSGPHSRDNCIPLGIILRDLLGYARNMNEANRILSDIVVKVNGKRRKEYNFPAGLMDVIDIGGDFYRIVPAAKGVRLHKTDGDESATRLAKVRDKTHVKNKRIQLNLHDGSNIIVDKDDFKTSDVVTIDVATAKIKDVIKFERGAFAVVTGGHNAGAKGAVESIDRKLKTVMLDVGGSKIVVPINYVFVLGRGSPLVNVGE